MRSIEKINKEIEYPIGYINHDCPEESFWLYNEDEIACQLEWFDSRDPEENATVVDNKGRPVLLVVKKLEIIVCQLA